jgi:Ca2+-binding EF-hand superfamily protein
VLAANFGRTGELAHGLSLVSIASELGPADRVVVRTADGFALDLAGVLLRFQWRDRESGDEGRPSPEEQLAKLDADKNGYLEKTEVEGQESAAGAAFDDWDADGDGKVYPSEIAAYDRRRQAPQLSAVRATASDDQDILFPLLDADQDGRLTARELAQLSERLARLDRDGDGNLAYDELPGSIGIVFDRGNRDDRTARSMQSPAATTAPPAGPTWFVHMDSNHDQFISRREFPGSADRFAALDTDGDGFINLREAEAAAKRQ